MASLAEIRARYPQYEDLSDEQFARGIHQRFYADLPFEDFSRRIGLGSPGYQSAMDTQTERENFANSPRDIPIPNWARPFVDAISGVRNVTRFTEQIPRNLGVADELSGAANYARQGVENIGRRFAGQPIEVTADEAARAASDFQRAERIRFEREHPVENALSIAGGVAAGGGPAVAAMPMTALRQALVSGVLDAPFAIARQEGNLVERTQHALPEIGLSAAFGGTLQALANKLRQSATMAPMRQRAQQFEDAGVRPTMAALRQGMTGAVTKAIGENWIAGPRVRAALENSIDDTAQAANRLSRGYGAAQPEELVGTNIEAGVRRFAQDRSPNPAAPRPPAIAQGAPPPALPPQGPSPALTPTRQWSFAGKANELYQRIFRVIERDELAQVQGGVGSLVTTNATQRVLDDITSRINAPSLAALIHDPQVEAIETALRKAQGSIRFRDLREFRSWLRRQQSNPELRMNINDADLQRLEQALTADIHASASAIAGAPAAHELRRADQFYRAGMQRIENALASFDPTKGVTPRQAYDRLIAMASDKSRQNSDALLALKRTLRPEEWRTVVATVIARMGDPAPGSVAHAGNAEFSVDQFFRRYDSLSDEGRRILFSSYGGGSAAPTSGQTADELMSALDNLAQVAAMQKGVEAMANRSRSGISAQNIGTLGALFNPSTSMPTAGVLGGAALIGEVLTNPAAVRLIAGAPLARANGLWREWLAALAQLAARDPALGQFYADMSGQEAPLELEDDLLAMDPATTP